MKVSWLILTLVAILAPAPLFAKKTEAKAVPAKELRTDFDYANDSLMRYFDSSASLQKDRLPQGGEPRSPQSMPVTQSGQNTANPPTIPLFK